MRAKSIVLLMIALGCGMVAAVAVSKLLMERDGTSSDEDSLEILVATQEIKNASKITVDKVRLEKWPKSRLPEGALYNIKDIEGKFVSQNLYPGEAILQQKLSSSNSGLGTSIPADYTIFDIPYQNNYIKPGDWVDISGTFSPPHGKNRPPEVKSVLRGIQVFAINGNPDRNAEIKTGSSTAFNLLIKQSQYQALLLASSLGKLDMNLRPLDDDGNIKTSDEDSGEAFLNWARDQHDPTSAAGLTAPPPVEVPVAINASPGVVLNERAPKEILIFTPNGVKRYEYVDKELPREIPQNTQDPKSSGIPANPWQSGTGFGGYSPTYPSTDANASGPPPASGAGPSEPNSNESAPQPANPPGEKPPSGS